MEKEKTDRLEKFNNIQHKFLEVLSAITQQRKALDIEEKISKPLKGNCALLAKMAENIYEINARSSSSTGLTDEDVVIAISYQESAEIVQRQLDTEIATIRVNMEAENKRQTEEAASSASQKAKEMKTISEMN